jgi:hypothetical protein
MLIDSPYRQIQGFGDVFGGGPRLYEFADFYFPQRELIIEIRKRSR